MKLLERAQSLSFEIRALDDLKKRAAQAGVFEKRANDLVGPANEIEKLTSAVEVIARHAIPVPLLDRGAIGALHNRITDLHARYAKDKNVMLVPFPEEDVRWQLNTPLAQLAPKVRTALIDAWGNWARAQVPQIDKTILDVLGGISALQEPVARVRNLTTQAHALCSALPGGDEEINRLKNFCHEIADAWRNLAGEGIPANVLIFLRASGSHDGATFDSLSAEVLAWLAEHGLRNALRIRIG